MDCILYSVLTCKNRPEIENLLSGTKGLAGSVLYTVHFNEIVAVYSGINRAELIADQANAIIYAGVIETLAQQFSVLPMRYGSVLESPDAIEKMLERNYTGFQQNLQKVENRFEYGLKVIGDPIKFQEISSIGTGNINHPDEPTAAETKESVFRDYVNKKLREHRKEEALVSYIETMINEIRENLKRLNATGKFKKMVTESTIIDAVFLLEKEKKSELIELVKDMQNRYGELNFIMTGPWPPYSFVELTIK
jgi:hypothetical protein